MGKKVELDSEGYSLAHSSLLNFNELISPPEVEIPVREYSQRSSFSNVPDGTSYDKSLTAPIGETLDKFFFRLSKLAAEAWKLWTNGDPLNVSIDSTGEVIEPLNAPIEIVMLTESERVELTRLRRLEKVETFTFNKEWTSRHTRAIQESIFCYKEESNLPIQNRYYEVIDEKIDEFGNKTTATRIVDRCQNNTNIKVDNHVTCSNIERTIFNPSIYERNQLANLSKHETEIWRKQIRKEYEDYLPSIGIQDDPDFINPSSLTPKKNFSIYPPASRPYNIVFRVFYDVKNNTSNQIYTSEVEPTLIFTKSKLIYPQSKKDYTSFSSMHYMIASKYKKPFHLKIDEIKPGVPNCDFEIDLRVSYNKEGIPDPVNYKKVDPETKLGSSILLMLNDQPYLFKEQVWHHIDEVSKKLEKKVALFINFPSSNADIKKAYWVYLDKKAYSVNSKKPPKVIRKKMIYPQIKYLPATNFMLDLKYEMPNYKKISLPFCALVRVSDNCFYFNKELDSFVSFKDIEAWFINRLADEGYIFLSRNYEDPYSSVLNYKFVHKSMATKEQRREHYRVLKDNQWLPGS